MKILLYNPNTTQSITNKLFDTAKLVASSGTEIIPMTATKGFPYISNKAEAQIAGVTVLEVFAKEHNNYDAAIIAAFGDPGLIAARSLFEMPIVGLGEAAMLSACLFGKKFGVISFTNNMSAWYEESVETLGLKSRYAGFRAIEGVVLSIDEIQGILAHEIGHLLLGHYQSRKVFTKRKSLIDKGGLSAKYKVMSLKTYNMRLTLYVLGGWS